MIHFAYTRSFIKQYNALESGLRSDIDDKLELFKNAKNHTQLKAHKLHGKLSTYLAFSVNYRTRILFYYSEKQTVTCVAIGTHDIYKN